MHKETKKITESQVEHWLGGDAELESAIDNLTDIANGKYSPSQLREDILQSEDSYQDHLQWLKERSEL
jgi:hypothetical protein